MPEHSDSTPDDAWVLSYGQSAYAVEAVESFQPLFHLLNGDLCYANLNPTVQPQVPASRACSRTRWAGYSGYVGIDIASGVS